MSKLLFDEVPVVVSKDLSVHIGLNEAIVLQQVYYWIEINKKANRNFREGKYWVYNSIKTWHEDNFNYWSLITVKRTFSKLEDIGLLLSANFNSDPRDNTKWYTVDVDMVDALRSKSHSKNDEGMSQPLVQNEPAGEIAINKTNPVLPLVQNAPMQCIKMSQPLYQNEPARSIKMSQPLPIDYYIDYNREYITHTFVTEHEHAHDVNTKRNKTTKDEAATSHSPDACVGSAYEPTLVYDSEFEKFWTAYPKKTEKQKAFRLWKARLKEGLTSEDLLSAAKNYSDFCLGQKTEQRFIKHPSTFLSADKPFLEWIKSKGGDTYAGINTTGDRSVVTGNSESNSPEQRKSKYPMRRFIDGVEYFY